MNLTPELNQREQTDVTEFYRTCAAFYDHDYAGILNEAIDFYIEQARELGRPVLEMGCGTVRVLIPTARAGITGGESNCRLI